MSARRSTRTFGAALLLALVAIAAACFPQPSSTPDPAIAATDSAVNWLISRFDTTSGLIPSAFVPGTGDPGASAYAITSLKLAGAGSATRAAALTALASQVDAFALDGSGHDKPGSLARLILAVVAEGGNPRSFGGHDLVARLEATIRTAGPDAGLFGVQSPTYDGAFRQGLALAALSVVTPKPSSIDPGSGSLDALPPVAWLRRQQCATGSWMYRADTSVACAPDPVTFVGPDSNGTALAVLGLHAIGTAPLVDPLPWLASARASDGGWGYDELSSSDPDSTGVVMAALRALGQPPDAGARDALLSFQFGSSSAAADRGAFFYPPFSGPAAPDVLATNDAVLGLGNAVWPASLVG